MFWKLVEIGTVFDWISPALQILDQLRGMTTVDATVDGWTGDEVKKTLERAGIRCGHGMIVQGTVLLPVDNERRALAVLADLRGAPLPAVRGWGEGGRVLSPVVRAPRLRRVRGRSRLWDLLEE